MKTAKITKIISANEFNWDHGIIYYIKMDLDNWETISLWKKNKDAFKVWDEVKYDEYVNSKGYTAWKEVKENNFKKWNSDYGKWAMIWMAIKEAFDLVYKDKWLDEAKKLTKEILLFANELLNEKTDTTESPNSKKEEEDLPF